MNRVSEWERRTEWPLAGVALLFLLVYASPILDRGLSPGWRLACSWIAYAAWAVFVVDYVARLALADRRIAYAGRHLVDLVIIALPILRPLRLLRLLVLLKVLNRRATRSLHGRVAVYVAASALLIIFCAALAEPHNLHANISSFPDALWWAATTVTTVGYGDRFPTTTEGRLVALGLMLAGIALIGVVTASIASWLIERVRDVEQESQDSIRHELSALRSEIAGLRELLTAGVADAERPTVAEQLDP